MRKTSVRIMLAVATALPVAGLSASAWASTVTGGGSSSSDCALVLEVPGANKPAPPKIPRAVDCVDGDPTCDEDGLRNGECAFSVQLCANSTALSTCTPDSVDTIVVDHADDNADDRRFDTDFQAIQLRADAITPSFSTDDCTLAATMTVRLAGPDSNNEMKRTRKSLRITSDGSLESGASVHDVDKVKFTCRPEGDAVYLPIDLYQGTFDRIRKQIFAQSCALSTCHDSEANQGNLILLPNSAYGNIVNVAPFSSGAAADSLLRVTPGDETTSFLYLKLTGDLESNYGDPMPYQKPALDADLIEIVRLWIIGDVVNGEAPETGWVPGTSD
jgi:hypothetical protein